jgi:hypothetical protein
MHTQQTNSTKSANWHELETSITIVAHRPLYIGYSIQKSKQQSDGREALDVDNTRGYQKVISPLPAQQIAEAKCNKQEKTDATRCVHFSVNKQPR